MTQDNLSAMMSEFPDMPLRDVVFNTLRRGILEGYLKPGERLMEVRLANRLGVSRTPIREAIRMLELEGLVVNIPRRGAQVASITEKDLRDVLEVREGLEELAVKLACERVTDDQLREIYEASRAFEQIVPEGDLTRLARADENFHDAIYRSSGNVRLLQLIGNLREQMYRYRVEYLKEEEKRRLLVEEHDRLWDSLRRRDVDAARKCVRQHIEHQEESISSSISSKSDRKKGETSKK